MNIEVFTQSAIKLSGKEKIYFDPFKITTEYHDADFIFITHDHYDHYDESSIRKVMNNQSILIVPKILKEKAELISENIMVVEPNKHYELGNIAFDTLPAYNIEKDFHPKSKEYVGYNLELDGCKYYVMGDTDVVREIKQVKTDICFVPIGGYYTMDVNDAAEYINEIKPKKVVPIHYGSIIGDISLQEDFKKLVNDNIEVEILIKEEEE